MSDLWETGRSKRDQQSDIVTRRLYKRFRVDIADVVFNQRVFERSNLSVHLTDAPDCLLIPESGGMPVITGAELLERRFGLRLVLVPNFFALTDAAADNAGDADGAMVFSTNDSVRVSWAAVAAIRVTVDGVQHHLAIRREAAESERSFGLVGGALEIGGASRHFPHEAIPDNPQRPEEFRFRAPAQAVADFEDRYRANVDGLFDVVATAAPSNLVRELIEELVLEQSQLVSTSEAKSIFVDGGLVAEADFLKILADA